MVRIRRMFFVALALSASVAAIALPRADAELTGGVAAGGIGESLILVVASNPATFTDAVATADELNARFGDLQGFYVDAAENYDVTGALVQVTPDAEGVRCPSPGETFEAVVESVPLDLDCPDGFTSLTVLLPVGLRYVAADDYGSFEFPSPCGVVGQPPCQRERYRAMLGDDLTFAGGFVVATAFRTKQGAEQFLELARSADVRDPVVVQAAKLAGGDIGLGQEPHPDGSGPLTGPLADQERYQR